MMRLASCATDIPSRWDECNTDKLTSAVSNGSVERTSKPWGATAVNRQRTRAEQTTMKRARSRHGTHKRY
jgi:hypothetical protein